MNTDIPRQSIPIPPLPPIPEPPETPYPTDPEELRRFSPISLGDWLTACQNADVPLVPAERVATIEREDYLSFDQPGEHRQRLIYALNQVRSASLPDHMVRFDCCSGLDIKYRLAKGEPHWRKEFSELILDDPRTFDIILEYPRPTIPIWRRPWIRPQIIENYPVEYRAYVYDGAIAGISNYYPQRELPSFPEQLAAVREYTAKLIGALKPPFLWHLVQTEQRVSPGGLDFTADYIVTANGNMLFLEGGPSHETGAHPCCFKPNSIDRVALKNRNG